MRRRGDGLGFAQLPRDTAKELAEVILGVMQRVGAHPKCCSDPGSDSPALGVQDPATADLFLWAQAEPRSESRGISELREIGTDLAQIV